MEIEFVKWMVGYAYGFEVKNDNSITIPIKNT